MNAGLAVVPDFPDADRWDDFVRSHAVGHVFQSWTWGEMQRGLGATPRRVAVVDASGTLQACVQLLVFEGTTRRFAVVPRGPVADPDDGALAEVILEAAIADATIAGATLLRVEPEWSWTPERVDRLGRCGFASVRQFIMPRRTIVVDLRPDLEAIWNAFRSNTRNRVRLAAKLGVIVREGGLADLPLFERWFEELTVRHQLRRAAPEAFTLALRSFGSRAMRLYLASHEGVDISGIIVFAWGRTAIYLWGASSDSEAARRLNPNQLLHWTAMQWARDQGCVSYDLFGIPDHDEAVLEAEYGRQTGGMWGLYRFKRGFGGRVHRHLGTYDHRLGS